MSTVAHDLNQPAPDSFPELYFGVVSNLAASTRIMAMKLPDFIRAASNPELVALLGDSLASTNRHSAALDAIVSRVDRPPRFHAAELETLLGTAARELDGWARRDVRDLALTSVLRSAVYMAIPACELAMSLAAKLGFDQDVQALTRLREDIAASDSQLQLSIQTQLAAPRVARATSTTASADLSSVL